MFLQFLTNSNIKHKYFKRHFRDLKRSTIYTMYLRERQRFEVNICQTLCSMKMFFDDMALIQNHFNNIIMLSYTKPHQRERYLILQNALHIFPSLHMSAVLLTSEFRVISPMLMYRYIPSE